MITKSSWPGKHKDQTWPAVGCWSQDFCSSYWSCHHFQKVNRKQSHLNHWDYQSYQHKITIGIAQACPVGNGDSLFETGINSNLSRSEDFVATTTWGGRDVLLKYFNFIKNHKQRKSSKVALFISYLKAPLSHVVTGVSVAWLGSFWFCAQGWQKSSNGKKVFCQFLYYKTTLTLLVLFCYAKRELWDDIFA